jgi:hypothetical protein
MILTNDRGAWNPSSNKCAAVRALDLCPKPNIAAVNQPRQRIRSFHKANDNRQKLKYPRDLVRDLCGISGDPRQSGIQPCVEQAPKKAAKTATLTRDLKPFHAAFVPLVQLLEAALERHPFSGCPRPRQLSSRRREDGAWRPLRTPRFRLLSRTAA